MRSHSTSLFISLILVAVPRRREGWAEVSGRGGVQASNANGNGYQPVAYPI